MNEIEAYVLPSNWYWTTLGSIRRDAGSSVNPCKHKDELFELYSVPSHGTGTPELAMGCEIGSTKQTVEEGAVLLCKINPRINRVWVVAPRKQYRQIASTEWITFPRTDLLVPTYLSYYLQRQDLRDFLASNVSGVGGSLMRVKASTLAAYPLPVAPLPEQRRIVEEIEKQFTRLDAAVAGLLRVQKELKQYRATVLQAACSGRLVPTEAELARAEGRTYETGEQLLARILVERRARWDAAQNGKKAYQQPAVPDTTGLVDTPEGWTWATLGQIFAFKNGLNFSAQQRGSVGLPIVDVLSMYGNRITLNTSDLYRVSIRAPEDALLEAGDVLIVRSSVKREGVGWATVFTGSDEPMSYCGFIIRARPLPSVESRYLTYFLRSNAAREQVVSASSQVTITNISQAALTPIPVPLPPLAEQERIVAEVERRLSVVEEVEAAVEVNLKRAERLRQAILKRAFEGRLVPQDPSDEPATVLLERIRAERAERPGSRSPRGRRGRTPPGGLYD